MIQSYTLISPDDSGTALLNISTRLASFKLSGNFVNATSLSDPTAQTPPTSAAAIRINTLWFVSLTLSIIAAFFVIDIQYWLAHLTLPKHIGIREAVCLRQLRFQGLRNWLVPNVMTVLPALVQLSVVLFLVGLLQYVRLSNPDVALPFTVIFATSFILFVVVSLMSFVDAGCPYKSPLLHIAWMCLWFVTAISSLLFLLPIIVLLECSLPNVFSQIKTSTGVCQPHMQS